MKSRAHSSKVSQMTLCLSLISFLFATDFKKAATSSEKHSELRQHLDKFVRDHLKSALKTNGTQSDDEITMAIKSIQDMLSKVSV